jgi:hypothetical protein
VTANAMMAPTTPITMPKAINPVPVPRVMRQPFPVRGRC